VRQRWYDASGKEIRDEEQLREELYRSWREDVPDEELILRDLKELRVPEVGPVVWPADKATSVGVRATVIDLGRLHDPQTRRDLARADLLADAAEQAPEEEPPLPTVDREVPAEEHGEPEERHEENDEPQPTEQAPTAAPPAGTHSVHTGTRQAPAWYLPGPEPRLY